jgi:creatinine amidohydrolase/Fe(II)-dependent formamide hydrolase-like protein
MLMYRLTSTICALALLTAGASAQTAPALRPHAKAPTAQSQKPLVDFEMMTWVEVKHAIQAGKTTALVYNGGTEQRGPQNVNGGHNMMARETARAIALKLGNAIVAPVLPFSPNNASAEMPGTIGLSAPLFAQINEEIAEQLIKSGFKNVVLMGDHGGGQKDLKEVAAKLDQKYASQGIRVVYSDEVYQKAQDDFDKWCVEHGYSSGGHANISDTSEMIYLGANKGYVRMDLLPTALGDPVPAPGQKQQRTVNNGVTGDPRRSSAALGKRYFDMKVAYAVRQIHQLLDGQKATAQ